MNRSVKEIAKQKNITLIDIWKWYMIVTLITTAVVLVVIIGTKFHPDNYRAAKRAVAQQAKYPVDGFIFGDSLLASLYAQAELSDDYRAIDYSKPRLKELYEMAPVLVSTTDWQYTVNEWGIDVYSKSLDIAIGVGLDTKDVPDNWYLDYNTVTEGKHVYHEPLMAKFSLSTIPFAMFVLFMWSVASFIPSFIGWGIISMLAYLVIRICLSPAWGKYELERCWADHRIEHDNDFRNVIIVPALSDNNYDFVYSKT